MKKIVVEKESGRLQGKNAKWSIEAELTLWNSETEVEERFKIELSEITESAAQMELHGLAEILTKHFEGKQ